MCLNRGRVAARQLFITGFNTFMLGTMQSMWCKRNGFRWYLATFDDETQSTSSSPVSADSHIALAIAMSVVSCLQEFLNLSRMHFDTQSAGAHRLRDAFLINARVDEPAFDGLQGAVRWTKVLCIYSIVQCFP
jgi:hypothetical protein